MDKQTVRNILEEIGILLELKGENVFRCNAYHKAARAIDGYPGELEPLAAEGRLTELPGIGEGLAEKITELLRTGHLKYYEQLKKSFPAGVTEMLSIQGLGPKRVKILYERLHIRDLKQLERACKENKLLELDGFGEKIQDNILRGLAFVQEHAERHLYHDAWQTAQQVLRQLKRCRQIKRMDIAGSLRRHKEIIRDVDILVSGAEAAAIMTAVTKLDGVERILAQGETKASVLLRTGVQCDVRLVSELEFPYALLYFTGSKEHNVVLRSRAIKRGMKLNEYGLFKGERLVACRDEEAIYKALGLAYIPPELRENYGEIEAAERRQLPALVEPQQIKGVFHVHSTYSDGAATLEQMVETAKDLGYAYVGMSDHSQAAYYAHGMKVPDLKRQHQEIDALNKRLKGIRILKGSEVDILPDGRLDYSDEVLASLDFVIASVHSNFTMPEGRMTERIVKALRNKHVSILGHPTGRLLLEREPYHVNMETVLKAAADEGVAVEINANPHRFDLDWRLGPEARRLGIMVSINPDAHQTGGLQDTGYGVGIARKGWFEAADVLNAHPLNQVLKLLARRKSRP